jgi:hypothetical protein
VIRTEIVELVELKAFPASDDVELDVIQTQERLLRAILVPVTEEEARQLITLFGPDDYFGMAWTLLHLIETAPNWPLMDCLSDDSNEWVVRLRRRAANSPA